MTRVYRFSEIAARAGEDPHEAMADARKLTSEIWDGRMWDRPNVEQRLGSFHGDFLSPALWSGGLRLLGAVAEVSQGVGVVGGVGDSLTLAGSEAVSASSGAARLVFRDINPAFPPNASAAERLNSALMREWASDPTVDCSDLARNLSRAANGEGSVLRFDPAGHEPLALRVPEARPNGSVGFEPYDYHEAFTDGRYVFDPRVSTSPVPSGDYVRVMLQANKGATLTRVWP